ncbi:MAG: 1-acyl-sn-glycerol-3-phosphate acyltransferase [Pseudomonadota bacterium]
MKKIQQTWTAYKNRYNAWAEAALEGTHNHYCCRLPQRTGFFASLLLKFIFLPVKLSEEQAAVVKQLPPGSIVIYATKYKSYFEYLFYHTRFDHTGLPVPEIGFNYRPLFLQPLERVGKILLAHLDFFCRNLRFPDPYQSGYLGQELLTGQAGLVSLIEKRGFYRRVVQAKTDPIRYLIDLQKSSGRTVCIVPLLMFFGKDPARPNLSLTEALFGTEENPGPSRRLLTVLWYPKKIFVEAAEPIALDQFLDHPEVRELSSERQSFALRNNLVAAINRHRQTITGPVLKTKDELKENILTSTRFSNFLEAHSRQHNSPLQELHKKADAYLEEIAADFSPAAVKIAELGVKLISKTVFDGISVRDEEISRIKAMSLKGPIILVPCHKSHMDYLVVPYILCSRNMPCPHAVAGKNLFFWPMGTIFRWMGAFSIRRTFSGAALYTKVFSEYIWKLLEEGFNLELFIEGGRSRTGKLLPPQLGFVSILLNAFKSGACEDLLFVPVYIGYDSVIEERSYLHEIQGGQKEPESLGRLIKAGKLLKKRYGKIYVRCDEPVSLKACMDERGIAASSMTPKEQNSLCRALGNKMVSAINRVSVVTPHALVASAILNCPKKRFSFDYLMSIVETYLAYLVSEGASLADTLHDSSRAAETAVLDYARRKFIEPVTEDKSTPALQSLFIVNESSRPGLDYYKNNCIAFFVPPACTALAIIERNSFEFAPADLQACFEFLAELFQNEFFNDEDRAPGYYINRSIQAFARDGMFTAAAKDNDTFQMIPEGFKRLKLFAGFLTPFFESYWIVLQFFMHSRQNASEAKDRLKKIQSLGNAMYRRNEIDRKEALSKITLGNAERFFASHGVRGSDDKEKITHYAAAIQRYLNYLSS